MDNPLPPDWGHRRHDALRRDQFSCGNCGKNGLETGSQLHVHHIVPRSKGGTHKLSNLRTLCKQCHKAVHNSNIEAPTAGPTIDYDEVADILQSPPEQWTDEDHELLNEVGRLLDEYAGGDMGDEARYHPSPDEGVDLSLSEWAELHSSQGPSDMERWRDLSTKWTSEI